LFLPPLAKSSLTLLKVTISKFKHTVLTPVLWRSWQLPTLPTGKRSPWVNSRNLEEILTHEKAASKQNKSSA
jgi:hypothetical protein